MGRFIVIPKQLSLAGVSLASERGMSRSEYLAETREGFAEDLLDQLHGRYALRLHDPYAADLTNTTLAGEVDDARVDVTPLPLVNALLVRGPDELTGVLKRDSVEAVIRTDMRRQQLPPVIDGEPKGTPDHLDALGARQAHALDITGKRAWIGFVDSGIDSSHPEFTDGHHARDVMFAEFDRNGIQVPGAKPHDCDPRGHGTHVAALAAGDTCGVAPDANIVMALAVPPRNGTPEQVYAGINWLVSVERSDDTGFGVDVVNLSLCSTRLGRAVYSREYRPIIRRLRRMGVTVIAAIGNSGPFTHGSPGNYKNVIGIGALDRLDRPWPKCCCGRPKHGRFKPDLCALGVDVWSALPGGQYGRKTGTSQAAPLASGLTALMIEQSGHRNPMKSILRSRAKHIKLGPCNRRAFKIAW